PGPPIYQPARLERRVEWRLSPWGGLAACRLLAIVGWVERSDTHQPRHAGPSMGIASLHPSYINVSRETDFLTRRLRSLPPRFPSEIGRENSQRCRRQTIEPARLPDRPRPRRFEFGACLVREPGDIRIVDIGQDQALVAPEGIDVGRLALEIDIVLG